MDVVHEGVAANTDAGHVLAVGDGQCRVATAQLLGTLPVAEAAVPDLNAAQLVAAEHREPVGIGEVVTLDHERLQLRQPAELQRHDVLLVAAVLVHHQLRDEGGQAGEIGVLLDRELAFHLLGENLTQGDALSLLLVQSVVELSSGALNSPVPHFLACRNAAALVQDIPDSISHINAILFAVAAATRIDGVAVLNLDIADSIFRLECYHLPVICERVDDLKQGVVSVDTVGTKITRFPVITEPGPDTLHGLLRIIFTSVNHNSIVTIHDDEAQSLWRVFKAAKLSISKHIFPVYDILQNALLILANQSLFPSMHFFPRLDQHSTAVEFTGSINLSILILANQVFVLMLLLEILNAILSVVQTDIFIGVGYVTIQHIRFKTLHPTIYSILCKRKCAFVGVQKSALFPSFVIHPQERKNEVAFCRADCCCCSDSNDPYAWEEDVGCSGEGFLPKHPLDVLCESGVYHALIFLSSL